MDSERQFAGYDVVARLATRATSAVYLARRRGMGGFARLVCLKVFRVPDAGDDEALVGFIREASIVTELRHDCCVRTDEVGSEGDVSYIAMEYLVGETLAELLARARDSGTAVPAHVVAQIVARVADGLHYAHSLEREDGTSYELVHRDVSPENVMITYEGAVKVLDFGVAKIADHIATRTGLIKGKVAYMSPEQITGQRIDRRTDVYALGIVFHEAIGNHRLYTGLSAQEIAFRAFKDPPPLLSTLVKDVPRALEAIAGRALQRDPAKRFETADEMAAALHEWRATSSTTEATDDVARYMREVFGDRREKKLAILEACTRGEYELGALLDVLDAKVLTNLDFPPEPANTEPIGADFETSDAFATTLRSPAPDTGALDSHPPWTEADAEAGTERHDGDVEADTRRERPERPERPRTPVDDTASLPPTTPGASATQPSVVARRRLEELEASDPETGLFGLRRTAFIAVVLGLLAGVAGGIAISWYAF